MKRGGLRCDEEQLRDHAAKRGRWGNERAKADAGAARVAAAPPDAAISPTYPLHRLCVLHGLPDPIPEYKFHPLRRWRADYAWPLHMVIVEIDGGVWTGGRHTRGKGFIADQQKLNAAALLGYRVLRYTPDRLDEALRDLRMMLA